MSQKPQAILCPYCGHTQLMADSCEACGGQFDAVSRRGVQVNMGPWWVRDTRVPFRPGFSTQAMMRLIQAGKVTAHSIIKGPTTHQFWRAARATAGVAHLLGYCHHCGQRVPPTDAQCPQCSAKFETPTQHDDLGLPIRSVDEARAAQKQLDAEVARLAGTPPTFTAQRGPDGRALCPYCGHSQHGNERCESCGGLFEHFSRRATMIAMGPWFVRNKKFPFRPGCSFDVLRRQIEAKKIDADTIIRGPTTRQFWAVAKHVPGVSQLLGFCWSCGASATAGAPSCPSCSASLSTFEDPNRLGLPFRTEAEAQAAHAQLESQVQPKAAPTPAPAPPMPVTGGASPFSAAGLAALKELDNRTLAVLASAPSEQEEEVVYAEPGEVEARIAARQKSGGRGRSRAPLIALLLIAAIAIPMMVLIGVMLSNVSDQSLPPIAPRKTPPVAPSIDEDEQAVQALRSEVAAAWDGVKNAGREGNIGLELDNLTDMIGRADSLLRDKLHGKAKTLYDDARTRIGELAQQIKRRDEAAHAKTEAQKQIGLATLLQLPESMQAAMTEAQSSNAEAQIYFDSGQFDEARAAWDKAAATVARLLKAFNDQKQAGAE